MIECLDSTVEDILSHFPGLGVSDPHKTITRGSEVRYSGSVLTSGFWSQLNFNYIFFLFLNFNFFLLS